MFVPRSYKYAAPPVKDQLNEKRAMKKSMASQGQRRNSLKPATPARTTTAPPCTSTPPIPVRAPERSQPSYSHATASLTRSAPDASPRSSPAHDSRSLPPAVAALLAVTHIPRPKQRRIGHQRRSSGRRISIDELVNEWKNDERLAPASCSSSPGLSILFEDDDVAEEPLKRSLSEDSFNYDRSPSFESVPSLDADDQSTLSNGSLSTPESIRSKRSISNLKKQTSRSVPTTEDCALNHPLIPTLVEDDSPDEEFILSPPSALRTQPKSTFTSNLTTSLQALKTRAINSISSLAFSSPTPSRTSSSTSPFSDDVLWSHPFLFPRFSPEIRPAIGSSTPPTTAQRRYLNPTPLTFEEQEAPYQLALHAPYLAEPIGGSPRSIQMQTYARNGPKRKSLAVRKPDPQSEAGRALLGAAGARQRELRENPDFLRIVVMEMNMKRSGKLEMGKARIWLPPRQVDEFGEAEDGEGKVPRRWVGLSAY